MPDLSTLLPDGQNWLKSVVRGLLEDLMANGGKWSRGYDTWDEMMADLSPDDRTIVRVGPDEPDPAKRGLWRKSGASGTGTYVFWGLDDDATQDERLRTNETAIGSLNGLVTTLQAAVAGKLDTTAISAAGVISGTHDGQYVVVWDSNTLTFKLIAASAFGGDDMTTYSWFNLSTTVGAALKTLVPADDTLKKVRIQNQSKTAYVAVGFGGTTAALNTQGSFTLEPGGWISEDNVEAGAVTVIASEAGTPVTCRIANTSGINPGASAASAAHLARYTGAVSDGYKAVIRAFYERLYNAKIVGDGVGAAGLWVPRGPNATDMLLNWAAVDAGLTLVNSPTWTRNVGITFDGATQYANTGLVPASSSLVALTSHGLFTATGAETTVSSNAPAASAGTFELNPKRTSTSMGIKSGTVSSDIVARTTTGGLKGFSRSAADRYTAYEGTAATEVATAAGSLSSYPLLIGARPSNAAGAPVAGTFYTGTVELLYVGGPLTASQEAALASAWSTYTTAIASL